MIRLIPKPVLLAASVTLFWMVTHSPATPQDTAAAPTEATVDLSPDLLAIRAGAEAFVKAFDRQDAAAVAALWTEDGEYIDETGQAIQGRAQIEMIYAEFFEKNPKARIRINIDAMRIVGAHTAIEDGSTIVELGGDAAPLLNRYTAVHEKVDGRWLMASIRESGSSAPSAQESTQDLEFLVGTWTAEEFGNRTESVCQWVSGKSFIERKYTTTLRDGSQTSGVQLIGWNPAMAAVLSWDFSPGGGHALGIWTPVDDGWTAEVRGYTADGTPIYSVNLLRRLDENAYAWQSVARHVGDTALPDTNEVVLKRKTEN